MDNERRHLRSLNQVWKDDLWPSGGGLGGPDPEASARHYAIAEVLCTIPEDDYEALKSAADSFEWFVPHVRTHGMVYPFTPTVYPGPEDLGLRAPYAKVLYLSPTLERVAWDIVVAVVAHELAHLALGHKVFVGAEYEAQEEETFQRVCKWGFEREAKKLRAVQRWRGSWERYQLRKFLAERGG